MSGRNPLVPPTPPPDGVDPKTWRQWLRERNMVQYKDLSDDEFRQKMEEQQHRRDDEAAVRQAAREAPAPEAKSVRPAAVNLFAGLDLGSVGDWASSLPLEWRPKFRREVARTRVYISKFADADPGVPLIEAYVFLEFVIRALSIGITAGRFYKGTAETIDILLKRQTEMAQVLGLTPQEKRKRGGATEATIADALDASRKAIAEGRVGRQQRRDRMEQTLAEKIRDDTRADAQEESVDVPDD